MSQVSIYKKRLYEKKYLTIHISSTIGLPVCLLYLWAHSYTLGVGKKNIASSPNKIVGTPLSKTEYLEKTYQEIKSGVPEAEVKLIEDSIKVLFPNHIVYNNKSIVPDNNYLEPLQKFASLLKKYRQTIILISGHSDSRGNEQKNRDLSRQRALQIKEVLITASISASRLEAWGLGSKSPIASNDTEEGRKLNRRVEFVILYDDK
jgi:outer membrane protein OmpA-like peptidoglycan-associated protein